jgi:hypothetical protein
MSDRPPLDENNRAISESIEEPIVLPANPEETEEERKSIRDSLSNYEIPEEYIRLLPDASRESLNRLSLIAEDVTNNVLSRRPLDFYVPPNGTRQRERAIRIPSQSDSDDESEFSGFPEVRAVPFAHTVFPRLQLFLTSRAYNNLEEDIKQFYIERYRFIPPKRWFKWLRRVFGISEQQPIIYYALKKIDDTMRHFFREKHIYGDIKIIYNYDTREIFEDLLILCWTYEILNTNEDIELNYCNQVIVENYNLPTIQKEIDDARSYCTISGGKSKKPRTRKQPKKSQKKSQKKLTKKSKKSKKYKKTHRK